jgi:hypothetical protein
MKTNTVTSFLQEEYKKSIKSSLDIDHDVLKEMQKTKDIARQLDILE